MGLDGDPALPPNKGGHSSPPPLFGPLCSGTVAHFSSCWALVFLKSPCPFSLLISSGWQIAEAFLALKRWRGQINTQWLSLVLWVRCIISERFEKRYSALYKCSGLLFFYLFTSIYGIRPSLAPPAEKEYISLCMTRIQEYCREGKLNLGE